VLLPEDYYKQPSEGASADDATIKHDNLSSEGASGNAVPDPTRLGTLLFDPQPAVDQDDELTASDDQTELMRWHYRLGHLSFPKLRSFALIGESPKRLANARTPLCAGCAFGTMTKLPWHTKENLSAIFTATKPGQ